MSIDRPNLADSFAPKAVVADRAAGLAGLLPPTRPKRHDRATAPNSADPARPIEHPEVEDAAQPPANAETTSRAVRALRAPEHTAVSDTAGTVANVAVYLTPDLLDQVRAQRRTTGSSYDELVVDAFARIPDEEIQRQLQPATPPETAGMPTRRRRPRDTAGIQIQLRLTGPQRAWLDTKQQALGAPSRSALVATALRLYLAS